MFNFDSIFFPTEEDINKNKQLLEEIHMRYVIDRENVKFILDSDVLYRREPFSSFLGDCCHCSHYDDISGMTEGGRCMLHDIFCGWGFTCKDNDSEWAVKI
jgi:hypothetical protein